MRCSWEVSLLGDQMWPDIIKKAKEGGLNTIQTYVFWNAHEPLYGQVRLPPRCLCGDQLMPRIIELRIWLLATVQFRRKIWLGEIHQVGTSTRDVCDPSDRPLHSSRMESWVCAVALALFTSLTNTISVILMLASLIYCRGLPYWLREVANITFRTNNQPYMVIALSNYFQRLESGQTYVIHVLSV